MDYHHSIVSDLFQSLNQDFSSSKNYLIDAINIIIRNARDSIKNTQSKMESCIDAITGDYVTFDIPDESSINPCKPISQHSLQEYNQLLRDLYYRANIGYNKIILKYEEEKTLITKMVHELKKKIELFYEEIQTNIEEVIQNSNQGDLLSSLKNYEKLHIKKCNRFKSEVDRMFQKLNKKCLRETQDFDKNINKHIWLITKDHIDILEKFRNIKLTVCNLKLAA